VEIQNYDKRFYASVMPPAKPSVPVAFRLPHKEFKLLQALQDDTGLDTRATFTLGLRALAKERGIDPHTLTRHTAPKTAR
jgi:hypothetical protein